MKVVHLDWETRSPIDPLKTSFDHLAKNCQPDLLTWGVAPDFYTMPEEVHCWDFRDDPTPHTELVDLLDDPTNWFIAFNSGFDEIVTRTVFGIHYPNNWLDSGVAASRVGFSVGKLEDLAKVMKCKHQKIELFPGLMKLFSGAELYGKAKSYRGRALYNKDGSVDLDYYKELRGYYIEYGIADTWTSAEIFTTCMRDYAEPYPIEDWLLHQRMNQRGLGVDRVYVNKMIKLNAELKESAKKDLRQLCVIRCPECCNDAEMQCETCRDSGEISADYEVASHPGFSKWLAEMIPGWSKGSAGDIILPLAAEREAQFGEHDLIARACKLKASALGTANAKFTKLLSMTDATDRTYNALRFNGAAQTGRPSGSGFQALNMARPYSPKGTNYPMKKSSDAYKAADMPVMEWIERYGYDAADVAAKIIRAGLIPKKDHKFVDFDFSGIESNAIMCMTQDPEGMRIRRDGLDGYIAFAVRQTGMSYAEIVADKEAGGTIRQDNKPAVLGCFAAGTQVLTDKGWKSIETVLLSNKVWNGFKFAAHQGVIDQGIKETILYDGIRVTPDHLFKTSEGWKPVCHLATPFYQDSSSIDGQLSENTSQESTAKKKCNAPAVRLRGLTQEISKAVSLRGVAHAAQKLPAKMTLSAVSVRDYIISYLIDSTPCAVGVSNQPTEITLTTEVEGYSSGSIQQKVLHRTAMTTSNSEASLKLTGLKMTDTTSAETCGWRTDRSNAVIRDVTCTSTGKARRIQQRSFAESSPALSARNQSSGEYSRVCPPVRLSQRVYDLYAVEDGSQFTVAGSTKSWIVHNCGYGMSGPALLKYAQGMGVYKPLSFWTGAVNTWREAHAGVVESWDLLNKMFQQITEMPPGSTLPLSTLLPHFPSTLERHSNGVCLRHPSGRGIWFRGARMEWTSVPYVDKDTGEAKSFKAYSMTYLHNQGKKTWRESLYGGKALGLNTQSLCNCLLRDWMRNIDEAGLRLVLQVYDQVLVEVPTHFAEYAKEKIQAAVPGRKDPSHWSASWDVQVDGGILDRFWK